MNKVFLSLLCVAFTSGASAAVSHSSNTARTMSYKADHGAVSASSVISPSTAASTAAILKRAESNSANQRTLLESVGSMGGISVQIF